MIDHWNHRRMLWGLCAVVIIAGAAFAEGNFDVTGFGAVGDGATMNTEAIQSAVDACAAAGGGTVLFPPGSYVTGTIYLKDRVHLRVEHAATILGSTNVADYPPTLCEYPSRSDHYTSRALIWGEGLEDVAITGPGTIDGQGSHFRDNVATAEDMAEIAAAHEREGRYPPADRYFNRPYLIRLISCRGVRVEGLSLRNSAMWMQQYLNCDFVTLRGLNVFNHVAKNNDMIDIDSCRNVIISDCFGDSDDDALTLKSTGADPTEHAVITNCVLRSHCNAIKAGTESSGGFNDITISNCVIQRSSVTEGGVGRLEGLAGIALEIVDGGTMERVSISNVVIEGTTAPIFLRLGNRARPPKVGDPKAAVGTFRDVSIGNVVATGASMTGCAIAGIPDHPIEGVTLSNIRIEFAGGGTLEHAAAEVPEVEEMYPESTMFGTLPAYGFYLRHVTGVNLRDIDLRYATTDLRPAIVADDVQGFRLDTLRAQQNPEGLAQVLLKATRDAVISGCGAETAERLIARDGECEEVRLMGNDIGG
jgi:polygalacturonase